MEIAENVVRFTLGGLLFEYDPEQNRKNIQKTEFPSKTPHESSLIITVLNSMTRSVV